MENYLDDKPISEVIRDRIVAAGNRYHASDNISQFIYDEEDKCLYLNFKINFRRFLIVW
jgi:hypothetical protein